MRRRVEGWSRITTAVAVLVASAAWTMTAAAGNPHGVAPGQQKASDSTAATASTSTNVARKVPVKAEAKGHVAGRDVVKTNAHATSGGKARGHVSAPASTTVQAQTSASAGVKPSSLTTVVAHNTVAPASSNRTKLYGNGKTAGQIATQAGFGSAMLFGPGNSQPHKTNCGPHAVDVHALKAHAAACAAAAVEASVSPTASTQPSVATAQTATAAKGGVQGAEASAPAKQSARGGGVLGAKAQRARSAKPLARAARATRRTRTVPLPGR